MRRPCASSHPCVRRGAGGGHRHRAHQRQEPAAHHLRGAQCAHGELVHTVREQCRTDDVVVAVQTLGTVRPAVPKLLIWDNAPPHHPHRVRDAARVGNVTVAFLPFRSPELMPLEDLWRGLKQTVAANRCYSSLPN